MRALLLAAGLGTRLRPLTDVIPKCLVPVNGRPLLEHWLESLTALGVSEILVNVHHRANLVEDYLKDSPYAGKVRIIREKQLLGTAGTLLATRKFWDSEELLFAHADNLMACDLQAFVGAHRSRQDRQLMTVMTFDTDDPRNCGIIETDGANNVVSFHEKPANPRGTRASAAVFILSPAVLEHVPMRLQRGDLDFSRDVMPLVSDRMLAWHNSEYHRDIGTLTAYLQGQIEYPSSPPCCSRDADSWQSLLERDRHALLDALTIALLQARNARERDFHDEQPGTAAYTAPTNERTIVIEQYRDEWENLTAAKGTLVIFKRVPRGFTSKAFRAATMCASVALLAA